MKIVDLVAFVTNGMDALRLLVSNVEFYWTTAIRAFEQANSVTQTGLYTLHRDPIKYRNNAERG